MSSGLGIGGHQSARMRTDTWLTPRHILDALGPFDLDPCSAPDPTLWPTAAQHITLPRDGLAEPWHGRVWLNPPYGQEAWAWLERLSLHGRGTALIFARTEVAGFVRQVWEAADAVLFLHGRLHFHHANGERAAANSGAPSCLVAYGADDAHRLAASQLAGTYVTGWRAAA
ncbi:DNA N-6-adenine-methyltransferase [Mycobacterium sp. C3-094]